MGNVGSKTNNKQQLSLFIICYRYRSIPVLRLLVLKLPMLSQLCCFQSIKVKLQLMLAWPSVTRAFN